MQQYLLLYIARTMQDSAGTGTGDNDQQFREH